MNWSTISNRSITSENMQVLDKPGKQATEVRQAGLIEAALRLAAQRSPSDITTGDLAQAVGITQGAVFRHFASKEAIWLATLDWVSTTLMARLNAAASQATALEALQAVFMAHVDFVVAHPGVPRIIFQELQHAGDTPLKARVRALMLHYRQLLSRLLTQARLDKTIASNTDLTSATVLFIGSIQGLVMQSMLSDNVAGMAVSAPGVYDLYQRGLLADTPT